MALLHVPHLRNASEAARSTRLRSGLAVLQVAVSVVLLVGAGLLIQSLQRLSKLELGFDPGNVLSGYTQILAVDYPSPEERNVFFTSVLDEIEALPGVVSASMVNKMPIRDRFQDWAVWPADQPPPTGPDSFSAMARWVGALRGLCRRNRRSGRALAVRVFLAGHEVGAGHAGDR